MHELSGDEADGGWFAEDYARSAALDMPVVFSEGGPRSTVREERGMKCPDCGSRATVIDTRQRFTHVTRRHFCDTCQKRFTTFEFVVDTVEPKANRRNPEQMAAMREKSSRGKRK